MEQRMQQPMMLTLDLSKIKDIQKVEVDDNAVLVQMIKDTIRKVEGIKDSAHLRTKSDAVKTAIDIADMVVSAIKKGGEVILVDENGEKSKIKIPSFNH